ncbi:conserved hypothetical membrane protein [Sphingobium sp. SYK-6]|uniref:FecR family protein n=1 Tax=Sphingobium sp. (strain NBRC 103272 / SYK-6) TaxID=627192 RepID=UPI000227758C|nr:FecR domain-containing protein [Sphingobium sp. SYK-6]BAK67185.1 conserved hypothetical membrane protein [Sphingobium sp. SYK-6]
MTMHAPHDPIDAAAQWYALLLQGRLTAEEGAAFDRWLAAAPANLEAFTRVSETWDELEERPEAMAPAEPAPAEPAPEVRRIDRRWFLGGGAVAAMALAASLALVMIPSGVSPTAPVDLRTAAGERRVTTLPDGSVVTLDGDSRVLVRDTSQSRALELAGGRALFAVRSDKARPFVVAASGISVTATGTLFSVERLDDQIQVELYEGGVIVRSPAHRFEQALKPGTRLVIHGDGRPALMERLLDDRSRAWVTGEVVLVDETLAIAVQRVNRMATRQIEVDPAVASFKVSGVFRSGEIDGFVDAVTSLLDVRAETDGKVIRFEPGRR